MTYKPVSIYIKKNPESNSTAYFCRYYAKNRSLTKARITKTTFENLKNEFSLTNENNINHNGAKK